MKRVVKGNFDLAGMDHGRLMRLALFGKFVPLGNLHSGPGARCLVVLGLLYSVGGPLYRLNARHGHRLAWLKGLLRRLRR